MTYHFVSGRLRSSILTKYLFLSCRQPKVQKFDLRINEPEINGTAHKKLQIEMLVCVMFHSINLFFIDVEDETHAGTSGTFACLENYGVVKNISFRDHYFAGKNVKRINCVRS